MLIYLFSISSLYLLCFQPLYIIFISMVQIVCYDEFLRAFICLWWITYNREGKSFFFYLPFPKFFCPFIETLTLKSNRLLCSYSSCFQTWILVNSQVQVLPGVAFFHSRTFCVFDAFLELLTCVFGYGDTRAEHAGGRTCDCHSLNSPDSYSLYSHTGSI